MATKFSLMDVEHDVRILERLVASLQGRDWESKMIARHGIGGEFVISLGGDRIYA